MLCSVINVMAELCSDLDCYGINGGTKRRYLVMKMH